MRIVVRGTNWIGDAVMTLPAIVRLRGLFPDSYIALQTGRWALDVFDQFDAIDEIIPIETQTSRITDLRKQAADLRNHKFDLALIFPNSFSSALPSFLAGIRRRIGFSTQHRGILLTETIAVPDWKATAHESQLYSYIVDSIGDNQSPLAGLPDPVRLEIGDDKKAKAQALVELTGAKADAPIIAIGAGSTNSNAKRWPAEYFGELCAKLVSEAGPEVILLGAESETETAHAVLKSCGSKIYDLTGKTRLSEAAGVLSIADLFISNDMGLAHLSAAVGTPTLVIFGPTNEVATKPLGANVRIIREKVECSPCMLRECPIDHRCMTKVSPERVFDAALEMLENL